jgi:hypothetical protein
LLPSDGQKEFTRQEAPRSPARKVLPGEAERLLMRAKLDVETLLQVVLLLVVVWLVLQIVDATFSILGSLLGPLSNIFGLIIVVLIILWLLDYL